MEEEKDDSGIEQDHCSIYIRVAVEDHHLQKVIKFNLDETVWSAKQKVLQLLLRVRKSGLSSRLFSSLPCRNYPTAGISVCIFRRAMAERESSWTNLVICENMPSVVRSVIST